MSVNELWEIRNAVEKAGFIIASQTVQADQLELLCRLPNQEGWFAGIFTKLPTYEKKVQGTPETADELLRRNDEGKD